MNIALCHESVLPCRGGCETYIASLAHRLVADGHEVHLYARRWDVHALPEGVCCHRVAIPRTPRFLRPWRFGAACLRALEGAGHQVTIGFDKTWGLDVLYPQGGLHIVAARNNLLKYRSRLARVALRLLKLIDPAHLSYCALEKRQYLGKKRPLVIAIRWRGVIARQASPGASRTPGRYAATGPSMSTAPSSASCMTSAAV